MGRRNGKKMGLNRIEIFSGKIYSTIISAATSGNEPLTGVFAGNGRFSSLTDPFNLFRFVKLSVEFLCKDGTGAEDLAVGFYQGTSDTIPSTVVGVMQCECSAIAFGRQTVPAVLRVSRDILLGQNSLKWWKTRSGTPDAWFETQGYLAFASGVTTTVTAVYTYTIEVTGFLPTSSTPLPRALPCASSGTSLTPSDSFEEFLKKKGLDPSKFSPEMLEKMRMICPR